MSRLPFARRFSAVGVAIATLSLLALGLRLWLFTRGNSLTGIVEYDDGPYVASSILLTHGIMPYRDYIFVQPPGIALILAPVAFLAQWGWISTAAVMTTGRVMTALASAAGVLVVGLVLRHRGVAAVVVGCGLLAVFTGSIEAAHTVLLEPWLVLLCALGMLVVFDGDHLARSGRLLWGGVIFGFAGAVEAWAVAPVAVLAVLCLPQWRRLAVFAGGVTAGFAIPVLPFALLSPRGFYQGVISAQIGPRANPLRVSPLYRFKLMAGLHWLQPWSGWATVVVALLIGGVVLAAGAFSVVVSMRLPPKLDVFVLTVTAATLVMFLSPSQFLYHFMGYWALWLALSVALTLSSSADAVWQLAPVHRLNWSRGLLVATAVPVIGIFTALQVSAMNTQPPAPILSAQVQRLIPPGSCVLSDSSPTLIMAGRLVPARPGCVILLDSTGADLELSHGLKPANGAAQVSAVEQMWWRAFRNAQFVLLSNRAPIRVPWTPKLKSYFTHNFRTIFSQSGPTGSGVNRTSYYLYKHTAQPSHASRIHTTAYIVTPGAYSAGSPSQAVAIPASLRMAGLTFLPSAVFALATAVLVLSVTWTRKRRLRPGYAPLWARGYVLSIIAVATVCGVVVHGFVGTGRHRKVRRPAWLRLAASTRPWREQPLPPATVPQRPEMLKHPFI
jgi:hypothetical protein